MLVSRNPKLSNFIAAVSFVGSLPIAVADTSQLDSMKRTFGTIRTIAGTGENEDGNFWSPSFEGAQGTDVELSNPHMTMADAAGNYYIADKESHSVLKVETSGKLTTYAGTHASGNGGEGLATEVALNNPNGLFVQPDGRVYVLDTFNRKIRRIGSDLQMTTLIEDTGGFGPGRGLWVSPDEGTVYYTGSGAIKKWTPDGGSETIARGISDPGNLTVDPDGHLVVTSSRGGHQVFRLLPDGTKQHIAGDGSTDEDPDGGKPATEVGLERVRGIAFRADGSYFLATQKGGDVWFVDTDNIIHRFIDGDPSGNANNGDGELITPGSKIAEPRSISLAPSGDLIITTNDKGYIRVVRNITPPPAETLDLNFETKTVTWQGFANRDYIVEGSSELKGWQLRSDSPGIAGVNTFRDLQKILRREYYYRVSVEP